MLSLKVILPGMSMSNKCTLSSQDEKQIRKHAKLLNKPVSTFSTFQLSHHFSMFGNQLAVRVVDSARVVKLCAISLGDRTADQIHLVVLGCLRQRLAGGSVGNALAILGKILDSIWAVEALLLVTRLLIYSYPNRRGGFVNKI